MEAILLIGVQGAGKSSTRERWIASSKAAGFRVVGYWFDVPLADALARNAGREGKQRIPDTAIRRLAREFEPRRPTRASTRFIGSS